MINSLPWWFWRIYRLVVSRAHFDKCNMKEDMLLCENSWFILMSNKKVKSIALCNDPFGFDHSADWEQLRTFWAG